MKYTYDWLGRMQTMTFPNWINNSFHFLAARVRRSATSTIAAATSIASPAHHQTANRAARPPDRLYLLDHIGYDEFEQRTVLMSGNRILNNMCYDAVTRRLSDVNADAKGLLEQQQGRPPTPFHRLHYTYDKIGNITPDDEQRLRPAPA